MNELTLENKRSTVVLAAGGGGSKGGEDGEIEVQEQHCLRTSFLGALRVFDLTSLTPRTATGHRIFLDLRLVLVRKSQ